MNIEKISDYCVKFGDWTVSKTFINAAPGYELWNKDMPAMQGRFDTFGEAKEAAKRIENRIKRGKEND